MATKASERKSFFKKISGQENKEEESEMTFFDHIEELRWHIMRSILAWLVAAIAIFVYIDWVYDNIILAPANKDFFTYGALCRFGNWLHMGNSFCMPPVKIDFQVTTVNGTFTSAISIAMIGGIITAFPYIFWEVWRQRKEDTEQEVFFGYLYASLLAQLSAIICLPPLPLTF